MSAARLEAATAALLEWCGNLDYQTQGLSLAQRPYLTREESATLPVLLDVSRFRELWREYQNALATEYARKTRAVGQSPC